MTVDAAMLPRLNDGGPSSSTVDGVMAECAHRLDVGDAVGAIAQLASKLARLRACSSLDEWRNCVSIARQSVAHGRLMEDPYMRGAFEKPRGYAGDAETLDFVYGYRSAGPDTTPLGRALLTVSSDVPVARAVRARSAHIAELIAQFTEGVPHPVVVSIACGHMRELHALRVLTPGIQFIGIDQDPQTIQELSRIHAQLPVQAVEASVRDILRGSLHIPAADLVYATGLYDYLDDGVAVVLTRILAAHLRPQGILLIANLTPANDEIACMEAMWDWWMVYRGLDAMELLATQLRADQHIATRTYTIAEGRVACLIARRNCADARQ
jgi:extracellular factor (EF) 3-hydroxypalmitic acid methyl ester biosynthesis protein